MPATQITSSEPSAPERLNQLLRLMNIEEVYYVDDLFDYDPLPDVVSHAKDLYAANKKDALEKMFGKGIKTNVPNVEIFGNEIEKHWEKLGGETKKEIVSKMSTAVFDSTDYDRTSDLKSYFPKGTLKTVNPDDWHSIFSGIERKYKSSQKKVLILFDQELKHAQGERFRNGLTTGTDLIHSARQSKAGKNIVCALITHLIAEVSKELPERDKIVEESGGALSKNDFFALTKKRINQPEKLCDGIKKVLLNEYCEDIKEQATGIIEEAYREVINKLHRLDTYDFDHTILRSSYGEGVWEVNTLMRIANNLYDQKIKELMVKKKFAKGVNPAIKRAKELSDITFKVPASHQPYKEKLTLRHNDIYHSGDHINKLHLPLENGDVFKIYEGSGQGLYILVAQECDLMIRTNRGGSGGVRTAKTAMLLKLKTFSLDELERDEETHFKNSGMVMHFYANKFKLEYFTPGKKDIGIVLFNSEFRVDLNALDLTVFHPDGKAEIDLTVGRFDTDLVSASLEMRYEKLLKHYIKKNKIISELTPKLSACNKPTKQQILSSMGCKLAPLHNIGKATVYSTDKFNFGIKRIMRLKSDGATYLLDRYYKHLSRKAEPHDFVS